MTITTHWFKGHYKTFFDYGFGVSVSTRGGGTGCVGLNFRVKIHLLRHELWFGRTRGESE